jgi:DNA-directed RNA polymerase specialized sigma24 family protein
MPPTQSDQVIRAHLAEGDVQGAVRLSMDSLGPEIFGFLVAVLGDADVSAKVYADVGQRIASELAEFRWKCPLRTWMYWIACRELQDRRRRKGPNATSVVATPDPVDTNSSRPTGAAQLRRNLSEEDRELLILRVDRRFDLSEVAVARLGESASPDAVARESQSLRRRMDKIVEEIHQVAVRNQLRHPG